MAESGQAPILTVGRVKLGSCLQGFHEIAPKSLPPIRVTVNETINKEQFRLINCHSNYEIKTNLLNHIRMAYRNTRILIDNEGPTAEKQSNLSFLRKLEDYLSWRENNEVSVVATEYTANEFDYGEHFRKYDEILMKVEAMLDLTQEEERLLVKQVDEILDLQNLDMSNVEGGKPLLIEVDGLLDLQCCLDTYFSINNSEGYCNILVKLEEELNIEDILKQENVDDLNELKSRKNELLNFPIVKNVSLLKLVQSSTSPEAVQLYNYLIEEDKSPEVFVITAVDLQQSIVNITKHVEESTAPIIVRICCSIDFPGQPSSVQTALDQIPVETAHACDPDSNSIRVITVTGKLNLRGCMNNFLEAPPANFPVIKLEYENALGLEKDTIDKLSLSIAFEKSPVLSQTASEKEAVCFIEDFNLLNEFTRIRNIGQVNEGTVDDFMGKLEDYLNGRGDSRIQITGVLDLDQFKEEIVEAYERSVSISVKVVGELDIEKIQRTRVVETLEIPVRGRVDFKKCMHGFLGTLPPPMFKVFPLSCTLTLNFQDKISDVHALCATGSDKIEFKSAVDFLAYVQTLLSQLISETPEENEKEDMQKSMAYLLQLNEYLSSLNQRDRSVEAISDVDFSRHLDDMYKHYETRTEPVYLRIDTNVDIWNHIVQLFVDNMSIPKRVHQIFEEHGMSGKEYIELVSVVSEGKDVLVEQLLIMGKYILKPQISFQDVHDLSWLDLALDLLGRADKFYSNLNNLIRAPIESASGDTNSASSTARTEDGDRQRIRSKINAFCEVLKAALKKKTSLLQVFLLNDACKVSYANVISTVVAEYDLFISDTESLAQLYWMQNRLQNSKEALERVFAARWSFHKCLQDMYGESESVLVTRRFQMEWTKILLHRIHQFIKTVFVPIEQAEEMSKICGRLAEWDDNCASGGKYIFDQVDIYRKIQEAFESVDRLALSESSKEQCKRKMSRHLFVASEYDGSFSELARFLVHPFSSRSKTNLLQWECTIHNRQNNPLYHIFNMLEEVIHILSTTKEEERALWINYIEQSLQLALELWDEFINPYDHIPRQRIYQITFLFEDPKLSDECLDLYHGTHWDKEMGDCKLMFQKVLRLLEARENSQGLPQEIKDVQEEAKARNYVVGCTQFRAKVLSVEDLVKPWWLEAKVKSIQLERLQNKLLPITHDSVESKSSFDSEASTPAQPSEVEPDNSATVDILPPGAKYSKPKVPRMVQSIAIGTLSQEEEQLDMNSPTAYQPKHPNIDIGRKYHGRFYRYDALFDKLTFKNDMLIVEGKLELSEGEEGSNRDVYRVHGSGVISGSTWVLKIPKDVYDNEWTRCMATYRLHNVAEYYVYLFQEAREKVGVAPGEAELWILNIIFVVFFEDARSGNVAEFGLIEKQFPGKNFQKFTSTRGYVDEKVIRDYPEIADMLLAFSHFTYVKSNGKLLVTDLQGIIHSFQTKVQVVLTDPALHTVIDELSYSMLGNQRENGFRIFFEGQHNASKCSSNHYCKKLGLDKYRFL